MADEDEVDVEGDFDMKIGLDTDALYDMNEPPSKSANLLPEFTQHPWVLEQGWSLDHCTDERSKAAIERMLMEEQHYVNGKSLGPKTVPSFPRGALPKRAWIDEEKEMFMKGLEIYGRSWSRIAELIPAKTVQQVKSYGQHYFKMKARDAEEMKRRELMSNSILHPTVPMGMERLMAAVTTGQPTVTVTKKLNVPQTKSTKDTATNKKSPAKKPLSGKGKAVTPMKNVSANAASVGVVEQSKKQVASVVELREGAIAIDGSEVVRIPSTRDKESDESDIEIDVDIDSDDGSSVLGGAGGQDDVYKKLVESAGIIVTSDDEQNVKTENSLGHRNHGSSGVDIPGEPRLTRKDNFKTPPILKAEGIKNEIKEPSLLNSATQVTANLIVSRSVITQQAIDVNTEPDSDTSDSARLRTRSNTTVTESETFEVQSHRNKTKNNRHTSTVINEPSSCGLHDTGDTEESDTNPLPYRSGDESFEDSNVSTDSRDGQDYEDHPDEFGILTSTGEIIYLPNPTREVKLGRDEISDNESRIHSEFFTNRPGSKNPDRYLKIRNFILDAWWKSKPNYLNKTSVRPGLKNCGDVNCIGRIHAYLEQVGAINFGCSQVQYRRATRCTQVKVKKGKDKFDADQIARIENARPRKRRVRDNFGQWIDEKDLEGRTIEHKSGTPAVKRSKVRQRHRYNPFNLIPCKDFSETEPAPFTVQVESRALVTMDIHAHMYKTEVIGLLGGQYNETKRCLIITMAVPCDSLSTGMQCEMDPVSQTEASEQIGQARESVVGWYHSHPTFVPNPSCRDLETQQKFQDWFGKGGNPFVGVIVSPYCPGRSDHRSQVRCLVVNRSTEMPDSVGFPYRFDFNVSHSQWNKGELVEKVCKLVKKYAKYPTNKVRMLSYYFKTTQTVTCLEKMLDSLEGYFPSSGTEDIGGLREVIKDLFLREFTFVKTEGDIILDDEDEDDEDDLLDPGQHEDKDELDGDRKSSVDEPAEDADDEQDAMLDL